MKHLIMSVVLITFLGIQNGKAQKKEFGSESYREQIKKELSFENKSNDNQLVVKNIFGSIEVEGYEGNTIKLEVEKTITADDPKNVELGKNEISLGIKQEGNTIALYADAPYIEYKDGNLRYINCGQNNDIPYDYNLSFKLKIPKHLNIDVSTINNGEILVKNTKGNYVKANNINGGIILDNITGQTDVHAINGEVSISYANNPTEPSKYYSLNGDINITYQKDLSADIIFKSMNGELFTDFEIEKQYAKTSKNRTDKKNGVKYKYESKPVVQIGKGGMVFNFETLNGNVIVKKI